MGIPLPMDNTNIMSVKIKAVARALPQYSRTTSELLPYVDLWLNGQEDRFIRKVKKIFEGAAVDQRYSIMSPEAIFSALSFEERNVIYSSEVVKLGKSCLVDALDKSGWQATDIDLLITVSCTGIMIPSLDAYLINELHLRQDVMRLPVTEMGCAAGVSGLIYAYNFMKSNPGMRAALIAVESPTATFQVTDFSMPNVVSAAMFGDGAACVLLSTFAEDLGPEILDTEMFHFYDSTHFMGFHVKDSGLQMILDVDVPDEIASKFADIIIPFLVKNKLDIADISHLLFHPGGKKIIQTAEQFFSSHGKNLNFTREVMRKFGNMSSVTVLYVLENFMATRPSAGEKGLMLSFGPGFTAQRILLGW